MSAYRQQLGSGQARVFAAMVLGMSLVALTLRAAPPEPRDAPSDAKSVTPPAGSEPVPPVVPPVATPLSPNVSIVITVVPGRAASVLWGGKRLGVVAARGALVVSRPRDSGPLDLIIRADGYLPVHTRAYTFSDSKLAVKLTALDQKATLLGYREELPPDAGAPLTADTPLAQ
jgi:hypothetical protein